MNKIIIEISAGELIDKITILEIKKEKINNGDKILKKVKDKLKKIKNLMKILLNFQEMFIKLMMRELK